MALSSRYHSVRNSSVENWIALLPYRTIHLSVHLSVRGHSTSATLHLIDVMWSPVFLRLASNVMPWQWAQIRRWTTDDVTIHQTFQLRDRMKGKKAQRRIIWMGKRLSEIFLNKEKTSLSSLSLYEASRSFQNIWRPLELADFRRWQK